MRPFTLGTKVLFSKSLSRQTDYGVEMDNYTPEQQRQLEEHDRIHLIRFKEQKHKEKQGFVCGKRTIVTEAFLEEIEYEFSGWQLQQTDRIVETVYVVACDMRGLYRVRQKDLEVIA